MAETIEASAQTESAPEIFPCELGLDERLHVSFQIPDNREFRAKLRMRMQKEVILPEAKNDFGNELEQGKNFWKFPKLQLDSELRMNLVLSGSYYDEKVTPKGTRLVVSFWFSRNPEHKHDLSEEERMCAEIAYDMIAFPSTDDPNSTREAIWDYAEIFDNSDRKTVSVVLKGISRAKNPKAIFKVVTPDA